MDSTAAVNATVADMPLPVMDTGHSVLVTLGWLSLMLGVIFTAYWLLRKFGFHGIGVGGKGGPQLVSRLMLGNHQSVSVVRYRNRDLVLGVTAERINLLKEFEADGSEPQGPAPKNFAAFMKRSSGDED